MIDDQIKNVNDLTPEDFGGVLSDEQIVEITNMSYSDRLLNILNLVGVQLLETEDTAENVVTYLLKGNPAILYLAKPLMVLCAESDNLKYRSAES